MRLMPGSPRPILPAILALTLTAFLPQLSSGAMPFPQDLEPISVVGRECKFKIYCVAIVIFVAGVDVKVKQGVTKVLYLITGEHSLVRCVCVCKGHVHSKQICRGLFCCWNIYSFSSVLLTWCEKGSFSSGSNCTNMPENTRLI